MMWSKCAFWSMRKHLYYFRLMCCGAHAWLPLSRPKFITLKQVGLLHYSPQERFYIHLCRFLMASWADAALIWDQEGGEGMWHGEGGRAMMKKYWKQDLKSSMESDWWELNVQDWWGGWEPRGESLFFLHISPMKQLRSLYFRQP
jgi:hypothetical protein